MLRDNSKHFVFAALLLASAHSCLPPLQGADTLAAEVRGIQSEDVLTLDNDVISLRYNITEETFTAHYGDMVFIREGRSHSAPGRASVVRVSGSFGKGMAVEIRYASGRTDRLAIYPAQPFIFIHSTSANPGSEPRIVDELTQLKATLGLIVPATTLRTLSPNGLVAADQAQTTYCWLAVADPQTRVGVVLGWLTNKRGSGIVGTTNSRAGVGVEARCEYGKLRIPADSTVEGETLIIGYFEDALEGLEQYADAAAILNRVKLPEKVPCGYCTWYSKPHGRAANEKHLVELADFCKKQKLGKFGFNVIQIDDCWQKGSKRNGPRGDYTTHRADGPYPHGMKPVVEKVNDSGFTAGLWLIPFAWNHKEPIFQDHQDWFVHRPDGKVYEVSWAGTCLDMSHPQARQFLADTIRRITDDWGFRYLKIDGLWAGMATGIRYPSKPYGDDGLGDAEFFDPDKTNIEVYRDGLKLIRRSAGDDVFLLGCNIAQNLRSLGASFGLVDGMRVGLDIGADWDKIVRCAKAASRHYFWHGRLWYNDPDCLMLREPLTLDQARAWASLIAVSGQMNLVSEWLPGLPEERLDIIKRTMPNHGRFGRPVDLFENELPRIWHLTVGRQGRRRDIVCLLNWDDSKTNSVSLDLNTLTLDPSGRYVGFDYWDNRFIRPFSKQLETELRPGSCRVISFQRCLKRPQLLSTSRHVTQGLIDVRRQRWDINGNLLSGVSQVIGNDLYELRIFAPSAFKATSVQLSHADKQDKVRAKLEQSGREVRVRIISPVTREITWNVSFTNK